MSGHTPGPWEYLGQVATPSSSGFKIWTVRLPYHEGAVVRSPGASERVVLVEGWGGDEATANAHLIAAAPDLLEALERCVGSLGVASSAGGDHPDVVLARTAIAKARGAS
jgi:hypothetical protein